MAKHYRSEHLRNRKSREKQRKALRKNLTPAEAALWKRLKNRQLGGKRFRRQYSVGPYILDFYCPAEKLAVELDGAVHFNPLRREYDEQRDAFLRQHGIRTVRFENREVFDHPERVLEAIAWHYI